jgi:hypothetical protein
VDWIEGDVVHRKNDALVFGGRVDVAAVAPKGVVVPEITEVISYLHSRCLMY